MWDWDLLNDNKALWLRSPSDVSEEEYLNFYKALAKVSFAQLSVHQLPDFMTTLALENMSYRTISAVQNIQDL